MDDDQFGSGVALRTTARGAKGRLTEVIGQISLALCGEPLAPLAVEPTQDTREIDMLRNLALAGIFAVALPSFALADGDGAVRGGVGGAVAGALVGGPVGQPWAA
jgi:hypothetical protein